MTDDKSSSAPTRYIVGVGASAGGLEALTSFVSNLPADFPESILIAQHLAPHVKSMMVELLARHSPLPVVQADDGALIAPGTIYIAPPNCNISVSNNKMFLSIGVINEKRARPSVDDFFFSLARASGARAVGIVLSGTGSDGAEGIREIHAAGGLTLAQDGFSAKYDGMPQSAIDTSCIDAILSPQDMAKNLLQLIREHGLHRSADLLDTPEWKECLAILKSKGGTDFSQYKPSTIRRRLAKRMQATGSPTLPIYLKQLRKTPGEAGALSQELLVSVTQFFRDPEIFDSLVKELSDIVVSKKHGEEVRVWVAGCATGEEAYTLAILITEIQERRRKSLVIKVFATDLDQEAILEARQGIYGGATLRDLPSEYLQKYFEPRGNDHFEVARRIRDIVVFARQDMIQNPPFVKLDLVTCRNVLIYFEPDLQKQVLEIFHYALLPKGLLLLGKSESLGKSADLFEMVDKKSKIFRRLDVASGLQLSRLSSPVADYAFPLRKRPERGPNLLEHGMAQILKAYGHSGAIVDKELHIVQVVGDISTFASFSTSQSDLRLMNLLAKDVGRELPMIARKVQQDFGCHRSRWYRKKMGTKTLHYRLCVRPLELENSGAGTALLLVDFETRKEKERPEASEHEALTGPEGAARVLEVEQELNATREHLQTVIEELGVANEELQALNEELSSTNEELQSTNEELETANEELQSGNEELTTLNEELNMKSLQLRELNTSLENIQESMGASLVVLDEKGRVLRYNREAFKIFNLNPSDLGKEIFRVSAKCEIPDFQNRLRETIEEGKIIDTLCEADAFVYQLQCRPFFNEEGKIIGAILVFFDNTQIVKTRERLEVSEMQTRSIVEGFSSPISLKDQYGRYQMVNSAFLEFFDLKLPDVIGRTDRDIFADSRATQMRESDLDVMFREESIKQLEAIDDKKGATHTFFVNRFPLFNKNQERPYAVGMIAADVSVQMSFQKRLQESEARYKAIIEDQAVLVCRQLPSGELIFTNSVFDTHFGESSEKHLGKYFYEYFSLQDQERAKADIRGLSSRHPVSQGEYRVFKRDGTQRWIRWVHRGIFDTEGATLEVQTVGFDVTDYITKTDRLLEKEAVFSAVLGNTTDIVIILAKKEDDFVVEYLNRTAENMLETYRGELLGKTVLSVREPERAKRLLGYFNEALRKNEAFTFDDSIALQGEIRHLSETIVPLRSQRQGESPDRIGVVCKDITSYKIIEKDLRLAKESAEVANQAKSDFLASMSHELRTPLNVVLGMATLLSETTLSEEQQSFVGSIDRSGKALLSLIEDVLDISKIESGKITLGLENFQLSDLVRDTIEMFSVQAQNKGLILQYNIEKEAHEYVVGDPGRLRQVLVNLIGNAIKFTDKGRVQIRVTADKAFTAGEKNFHFEVQDSGIGIKEKDRDKIFKRFSQVESGHARRYGGSGLGLVISREIVRMMKGEMGFTSTDGHGSTFWFDVQLHRSTETALQSKNRRLEFIAKNKELSQRPLRILAIDDNRESLNIIRLFLKRLGHDPVVAASGLEALNILDTEKIELVLMDVQMPELDGYQTTARIRANPALQTDLPIIALTANAMAGDIEKCLKAGMNDYLSKPVRLESLKEILNKWSTKMEDQGESHDPEP